jgi:predicted amidohydrolase
MDALLIQGALLTDPAASVDAARDVLVVSGRVALVAERITPQEAAEHAGAADGLDVLDARGLWLPGKSANPGGPATTVATPCKFNT